MSPVFPIQRGTWDPSTPETSLIESHAQKTNKKIPLSSASASLRLFSKYYIKKEKHDMYKKYLRNKEKNKFTLLAQYSVQKSFQFIKKNFLI